MGNSEMDCERGFSLIEMMVTMLIALVILAGLLLSFQSQYGEYKYQNKRVDAVQDLELGIRFISDDLRLALMGSESIVITDAATSPYATTDLFFRVWSENSSDWASTATAQTNSYRARRHYQYDVNGQSLAYDRNTVGADSPDDILNNVTFFKVFTDTPGVAPAGYAGAPPGLPSTTVVDPTGNLITVSGYTVLIEISIDAGYKLGSFTDVLGNNQAPGVGDGRKRVWRYVQIYPKAAVNN